jgi:transcriptional regulator with XRE-family HTH domain
VRKVMPYRVESMSNDDVAAWPPSDTAAEQINRLRKRAGLNREQLAERIRKLGGPSSMTAAAIANIETGRRDAEGRRRRDLTLEELALFAGALGVPPVLLEIPVGSHDLVEVLPGRIVSAWLAAQWFTGEGPLPTRRGDDNVFVTNADYAAWERGAAPLDYYRRQDALYEQWREIERRKRQAVREEREDDALDEELQRAEQAFFDLRQAMRRAGIRTRPLPAQIAHLDPEGGATDARHQEDRPQ